MSKEGRKRPEEQQRYLRHNAPASFEQQSKPSTLFFQNFGVVSIDITMAMYPVKGGEGHETAAIVPTAFSISYATQRTQRVDQHTVVTCVCTYPELRIDLNILQVSLCVHLIVKSFVRIGTFAA